MELITPRLRLRDMRESDFEAMLAVERDPEVQRFERDLPGEQDIRLRFGYALEEARESPRTRYQFAVTVPPADELIGRVSLKLTMPDIHQWELGWYIRRAMWGNGYATEAARALMDFAFNERHAHRLVAFCHTQNSRSERVMQKLGMTREAQNRATVWIGGQWHDELLYAILDDEFFRRNP
ncbi:MAG TPA: GNAT family N-acetyltransferase [Anaerolineaceae bacterium]